MTLKGIDVSVHQSSIDWKRAKSEIDFAILRLGWSHYQGGLDIDKKFSENVQGCINNDIPWGVYIYAYDKTPEAAKKSAQVVVSTLSKYQVPYPIYYDIEDPQYLKMSRELNTSIASSFLSVLESSKYYAGLYTFVSFANSQLDMSKLAQYDLWMAHYSKQLGWTKSSVGMWQYANNGKVNGIATNVDLNECYKDYPSIIKKASLNNYYKDQSATETGKESYKFTGTKYYLESYDTSGVTCSIKESVELVPILHPCAIKLEDGRIVYVDSSNLQKVDSTPTFNIGDKVRINYGANDYQGNSLASFVYSNIYKISSIVGDRVVVKTQDLKTVIAAVHKKDLIKV